jgi:hypothetical protein
MKLRGLLIGAALFALASPAYAVPITYTMTDTASGSLNGVAFSNSTIVLTETADTTNITERFPGQFWNSGTMTLSVSGGALVTFTDQVALRSLHGGNFAWVDFIELTANDEILLDENNAFATYFSDTAIGPVTATSVLFGGNTGFSTTGGTFILTSAALPTFTATIPEPASLAIFGAGLAVLGVMRRKRNAS